MSAPQPNYFTVLDDYVANAKALVRQFGWPVVFTCIGLYWAWPYITVFRKTRALASANDPGRRRVLDEARARVREQQQKKISEAASTTDSETSTAGTASSPAVSNSRPFPSSKF